MYRASIRWIVVASLCTFVSTPALAISGVWGGHLRSSDGQLDEVVYGFSASGHPIFLVPTSNGLREVEVRHVGQTHQWRTPGGAIASGRVDGLSVTAAQVRAVITISTESGGGALMDQREERMVIDLVLSGNTLQARVQTKSTSYSSGQGIGLYGGRESRNLWQGSLQRIR